MQSRAGSQRAVVNQRGFNLLEVMASVVIVAIVAVGLTASTIMTIKSNAFSGHAMTATSLAQDEIELLRSMPYDAVSLLRTGSENIAAQAGSPPFTREWVVTTGPTPGLIEVAVTVRWRDPEPRSVTTTAFLCRALNC